MAALLAPLLWRRALPLLSLCPPPQSAGRGRLGLGLPIRPFTRVVLTSDEALCFFVVGCCVVVAAVRNAFFFTPSCPTCLAPPPGSAIGCLAPSTCAVPPQVFLFTPASAAATKLEEKKSTLTAAVSKATAALAEVEGEVARLKAKLYSKFGGVRFCPSGPSGSLCFFFSFLWACVLARPGALRGPRGECVG